MSDARPNTSYTDAQREALPKTFKPGLTLNAARAKFANHVMRADGSIDDDVASLTKAVEKQARALASSKDLDAASLRRAADLAAKREEIEDHIAQKRFLFVVDENDVPVVYFQCAVPNNPDVE